MILTRSDARLSFALALPSILQFLELIYTYSTWPAKTGVRRSCSQHRIQWLIKLIVPGSCDANDAVHVTVVQPGDTKPKTLSTFHPQFTYPIFGDDEQIFGYKGLIIRLRFAAHDLRPHVHISYDDRFKAVGDTAAVNLLGALKPFVPQGQYEQ